MKAENAVRPGDVVQINEQFKGAGWVGAFVLVTEVKTWGVQGFVHHVKSHDTSESAFIRLNWEQVDFVGHAGLVPAEEV